MTRSRPIVMSGPMVQAILAGKKTCTRRVLTDLSGLRTVSDFGLSDTPGYAWHLRDGRASWHDLTHTELLDLCPFGHVGDRLWVKETWNALYPQPNDIPWYHHELGAVKAREAIASGVTAQPLYRARKNDPDYPTADDMAVGFKWQSPRFMPRWASRLTLEVTGVSVERLHDITNAEAIDEGVTTLPEAWLAKFWPDYVRECDQIHAHNARLTAQGQFLGLTRLPLGPTPRERFQAYWSDLHGADAWGSNPWVWRIEFKQVPA